MSLLTPTETVTARIAADAEQLAAYVQNAVALANRIASSTLSLPTPELNDWLNARPLQQRLDEFASHGATGEALNAAAESSEQATGKATGVLGRVDVRSVQEKLATQNRELEIIDGAFVVTELPFPEPEQPTPDPENVEP
jgi:hypothetical protein